MIWLAALAQAAVAAAPAPAPAAAPAAVTSYPPAFFASLRPATALEMVQRLPGFSLDVGADVRGYEGSAGNVLIDGQRPATKTDRLDELLKRLPASQVARIDVIHGSAPGIDMQGKTVLANVIRTDGGPPHVLVAIANTFTGDEVRYPGFRLEGSGRAAGRSWEAGLAMGRNPDDGLGDGPRLRLDRSGLPLLAGDVHSRAVGSNTTLTGALEQPLLGGRLRITGRLLVNPYDLDEVDTIRLPDRHLETEHDDDNVRQTEFGGRYTRALTGRLNLEAVGLRQDKHEQIAAAFSAPGDVEDFRLDNRNAETIGRAVLKFQQSSALSWEGGGEAAYNTQDSKTRFALNGAAVALPAANVTVQEKRGEVFGKAVWQPLAGLTAEGSIREEGSRIGSSGDVTLGKSLFFTKPRLAITWAAGADTQVRLRQERVVGQLDFSAFVASQSLSAGVVTAGNPDLVPEQAWVSEAAVERRFLGSGSLVFTLRHSAITDVVDRAPMGNFDAPANIGPGRKDEFILNVTLPLSRFDLKGAQLNGVSTWRTSEVTDPTTRQKRPITRLHPLDWEAHFSQDLPGLGGTWGVDAFGGWSQTYYRFNEVEVLNLGPWVAPFVEWKPRRGLSVRVELDNFARHGVGRTLSHYDGARGAVPLSYVETRDPHFERELYVRIRKTFGD